MRGMFQKKRWALRFSRPRFGNCQRLFLKIFGAYMGLVGRKIIIFVAKSMEII